MTEYLLLFRNFSAENENSDTSTSFEVMVPKWQSWIGTIAQQGKLVHTAPIHPDSHIVSNNGVISSTSNLENNVFSINGFLICKSDSLDEVQQWSKTCPILEYQQGTVEIRPLIPFPTA